MWYINATYIFHNMLIELGPKDTENEAWDFEEEESTVIDDAHQIQKWEIL